MSFYITKLSGEKQLFDPEKLRRSLHKSKTPEHIINDILREVEKNHDLRTTKAIYSFAYNYLAKIKPALAARYSLKQALIDLGPAGFPFEQYIAHLFRKQGYSAITNQIVTGHCVQHEVDIICSSHKEQFMVECKFHANQTLKCDVKVSLYVKGRFDDIHEAWEKAHAPKFHQAWIVTNTKFTTEAIKFAECRNIRLLGWSYPEGNALPDLVTKYELHPVTALTNLNADQKMTLIKNNIVLCHDAVKHEQNLKDLGFSQKNIDEIIKESVEVCEL